MKEIFSIVIKRKVKGLIEVLGVNISEIVVDIPVSDDIFNSIEYDIKDDKIYLYIFDDELEYIFDFDELIDEEKVQVYKILELYL
jgi:hypothetical protein